jgi:hypothetical protein
MATIRSARQPDLFAAANAVSGGGYAASLDEPPPADFIERIRSELQSTLALARGAMTMPWRDLTAATLAELRFKSIAGWLPADEASTLRASFAREMARLWEIVERDAAEAP